MKSIWRRKSVQLLLLILFFIFYILCTKLFTQTADITEWDKETLALKYKIDDSYGFEWGNYTGIKYLRNDIVKTDQGVLFLDGTIDFQNQSIRKGIYIIKEGFIDAESFAIAEPLVKEESNKYKRGYYSVIYNRYKIPRKYSSKDTYSEFSIPDYRYFKDKNNIYYVEKESRNEAYFRHMEELGLPPDPVDEHIDSRLINYAHTEPSLLRFAKLEKNDIDSWELIGKYYSKNKDYVYYKNRIIIDLESGKKADPLSVEVVSDDSIRDKHGLWNKTILQ